MKKYSILLCLLAVLGLSCSKDKKDENNYFFRFTLDGVQKEYNVDAFATLNIDGSSEVLILSAAEKSGNDSPIMGFTISNHPTSNPIVSRVYDDKWDEFQTEGGYSPNGVILYQAGATLRGVSESVNIPITNHLRFEIKAISGGTMTGTFSGDFYKDAEPDEEKKVITGGEFFVPLIKNP